MNSNNTYYIQTHNKARTSEEIELQDMNAGGNQRQKNY